MNPGQHFDSGFTVFQRLGIGLWSFDRKSGYLQLDVVAQSLLGLAGITADLQRCLLLVEPDYRDIVEKCISDWFLSPSNLPLEVAFPVTRLPSGSGWIEIRGYVSETGDKGQNLAATGIVSFLPSNRQFGFARLLERVVEAIPAQLAIVDVEGEVVITNTAWRSFVCESSGGVGGTSATGYGVNSLSGCVPTDGVRDVLKGKLQKYSYEYPCSLGQEGRWFQLSATPLPGAKGGSVLFQIDVTSWKRIEQELSKQLELTSRIVDSAPGLFYLIDHCGSICRWNKTFEDVAGVQSGELSGTQFEALFDSEFHPAVSQALEDAFSGQLASLDLPLMSLSGVSVPYYFTLRSVDLDGVAFVIGFGIDISTQKKTLEELETYRQHLRSMVAEKTEDLRQIQARKEAILQSSPFGIGVLVGRKLVEVNDALLSMTGFARSEVIGNSEKLFFGSDQLADTVRRDVFDQMQRDGIGLVETIWKIKCGAERNILLAAAPINRRNFGDGISFSAVDITYQKKIETSLRDSEQFLRSVTDTIPGLVSYWGPNLLCQFANAVHGCWIDRSPADMLGKSMEFSFGEDFYVRNLPFINKALQGERQSFERIFKKCDQASIHTHIDLIPDSNSCGNCGFFMLISDVSSIKNAEKELRSSQTQLRSLLVHQDAIREEERNHLVRELHDEIGQLLTGMRFTITALQLRPDRPPEEITEIAGQLGTYVDQTQGVVRQVSTDLRPTRLEYGLLAALEGLATDFKSISGVPCRLSIRGAEPMLEKAKANAIYRIVQESLTNVARHAQASVVNVQLTATKQKLKLLVRDNGKGFDVEAVKRTSRSLGLFGMGERARSLGAELTVDSTLGSGTSVVLLLVFGVSEDGG